MKSLIALVLAAFTFGAFAATKAPVVASAPAKTSSVAKVRTTKPVVKTGHQPLAKKVAPASAAKK